MVQMCCLGTRQLLKPWNQILYHLPCYYVTERNVARSNAEIVNHLKLEIRKGVTVIPWKIKIFHWLLVRLRALKNTVWKVSYGNCTLRKGSQVEHLPFLSIYSGETCSGWRLEKEVIQVLISWPANSLFPRIISANLSEENHHPLPLSILNTTSFEM